MVDDVGQGKWKYLGLKTDIVTHFKIWYYKQYIKRNGTKRFMIKYG